MLKQNYINKDLLENEWILQYLYCTAQTQVYLMLFNFNNCLRHQEYKLTNHRYKSRQTRHRENVCDFIGETL